VENAVFINLIFFQVKTGVNSKMQFSSFLFSVLVFFSSWAGTAYHPQVKDVSSRNKNTDTTGSAIVWARQVLDTLTLDEKLGQLFMIPVYSNKGEDHVMKILKLVMEEKVGGIIFMQGGPTAQTHLANVLQRNSDLPLMVSQDAEWGVSMRLDSVLKFPKNMTLGAIRKDTLIYQLGKEIARQCRATGVQINFSPVADINNNSNNPVINDRSFGEDKFNVTRKSIAMMRGLQDGGVMACAKHFPGHGDTQTDSHLDLPVILHDKARMDSLELYPFREMIKAGVQSVMMAHLYLPAYEKSPNRPSTVSKVLTDTLLRQQMGFNGLIFTDALNMKGIAKYYSNGEAELQALLAGNDILLFSESVGAAKIKIKAAIDSGYLSVPEIDQRVMRILAAKYSLGLVENRTTDPRRIKTELHNTQSRALKLELYRKAITLAADPKAIIPIQTLKGKKIAFVQCGGKTDAPFIEFLNQFAPVEKILIKPEELQSMTSEKAKQLLAGFDLVISGMMGMERNPARQFGIKDLHTRWVQAVNQSGIDQIVCVFGNPYALKFFPPDQAILLGYEEDQDAQQAMAEGIFGSISLDGQLPVSAGSYPALTGLKTQKPVLEDASPLETGMSPDVYRKVDSIVMAALRMGAMPGCAILVKHKNKTILARGYGSFRGDQLEPVDPLNTRFDLASVTKVAATTLSVMLLYDKQLLHPDSLLEKYLPELKSTDKGKLSLRSLLLHQSGLPAFLPLQQASMLPGRLWKPWVFSSTSKEGFRTPIGPEMYQADSWQDSIWNRIYTCKVSTEKKYLYSDLGMILLGRVVERVSGLSLDSFTQRHFYEPLKMRHTGFCPWVKNGYHAYCPPTEVDKIWRKSEVQGFVHDQTSAMLGGVAGHAGLFSSAADLGILMSMLAQGGVVQGDTFLQKKTIEYFTGKQNGSRRGLGWDKPLPGSENSPCAISCSPATFGHTGFTGTCVWVDPEKELIFIFLSNRTWPDVENRKLIQESVRTKIQDIIYKCVISG
jgi:beta-N-acetylhexosaminidase